jgi:hypothetical protein
VSPIAALVVLRPSWQDRRAVVIQSAPIHVGAAASAGQPRISGRRANDDCGRDAAGEQEQRLG